MTEELQTEAMETVESNEPVAEESQAEVNPEQTSEPEPQSFKVKINGEEKDVNLEELLKGYSTSRASHEKFQEASRLKSKMDLIMENFSKDPVKGLTEFGIDPNELAFKLVSEQIDAEMLTPEETAQNELQSKFEKQQKELEELKGEKEKSQLDSLTEKYVTDYETKITNILNNSKLPKNAETVKRIADYMYQSLESGFDLTENHIVDLVKEDYHMAIKSFLGESEPEALIEFLGNDAISRIRKHDLQKIKTPEPTYEKEKQEKPIKQSKRSVSDFMSDIEEQYR